MIAEYIRRHHYHESVAVLQHFMPIRANDKEFEETSDSEDEEEEEKENDSTNGSDLGTWLEPDLKKGTLHFCNIPQIISEFFTLKTCLRTYIFSSSPFRVQLLHHRTIKNQVRAIFS